MKQCKPCITIRDIALILKNNVVFFYTNIKNDIKSYRNMNAAVCVLDKPVGNPVIPPENRIIENIRKKARDNYSAS